ncbi:uncharacterized protein MONBRDRAFT_33341 [Monosiga brevicollis MX1]|uniref:Uncharacterized protein n=1 Tax=Monosiga brevicollis TaxID=81824 RepID=A9V4U2_MONBE|nr:uncharacterized protein MONBRDRAFT_33341 [Monosiga brevicollis MX1]EDQ87515.1 predicted protein [Monosiga brevicollis MX1]|eukprot:XP_001747775.1 hypothetical protein [Monosiga brevicollis MX1]
MAWRDDLKLAISKGSFWKSLSLAKGDITDNDLDEVIAALTDLPNLETINLSRNKIGAEGIKKLLDAAKNLVKVKSLDLRSNVLDNSALKMLALLLPQLPDLQVLHIGSNTVGDPGASAIAGSLAECKKLHTLTLGSNGVGNIGMKDLADAFAKMPQLRIVKLWGNRIEDNGIKALGAAMKTMSGLESIEMKPKLFMLGAGHSYVQTGVLLGNRASPLSLDSNKITDEGAAYLAQGLVGTPKLQFLDLNNNLLTDAGVEALAQALPTVAASLQTFDVSKNKVKDKAVLAVANVLPQLKALKTLEIKAKKLEVPTLRAVAVGLAQTPPMEAVEISTLTKETSVQLVHLIGKHAHLTAEAESKFLLACLRGDPVDIATQLRAEKVDQEAATSLRDQQLGFSVLHWLCVNGNLKALKAVTQNFDLLPLCNLEVRGFKPMQIATLLEHQEVVAQLQKMGDANASPQAGSADGAVNPGPSTNASTGTPQAAAGMANSSGASLGMESPMSNAMGAGAGMGAVGMSNNNAAGMMGSGMNHMGGMNPMGGMMGTMGGMGGMNMMGGQGGMGGMGNMGGMGGMGGMNMMGGQGGMMPMMGSDGNAQFTQTLQAAYQMEMQNGHQLRQQLAFVQQNAARDREQLSNQLEQMRRMHNDELERERRQRNEAMDRQAELMNQVSTLQSDFMAKLGGMQRDMLEQQQRQTEALAALRDERDQFKAKTVQLETQLISEQRMRRATMSAANKPTSKDEVRKELMELTDQVADLQEKYDETVELTQKLWDQLQLALVTGAAMRPLDPSLVPAGTRDLLRKFYQPVVSVPVARRIEDTPLCDDRHMYEVVVTVGLDMWAVKRRCGQLCQACAALAARVPGIGQLEFPPKVTVTAEDEEFRVVEERRLKLQLLLAGVLRLLQANGQTFLDKLSLIKVLPILSDTQM